MAVILWTDWILEFKTFRQGRELFAGSSIGGWWINEESPLEIVDEVLGRCRDYDSRGWADFTPLDRHAIEWQNRYEQPPPGWEFFSLNVRCNDRLPAGWADRYLATIPEDLRATREHGAFASRVGAVFKEFRRHLHVVPPFDVPRDWHKIRGIDFGWNHPTTCVWIARDGDGNYYVYDCYWASGRLLREHARAILERPWSDHAVYGRTYADGSAAQEIAEFARLGISCCGARKSIELGIECLRKMMMPQTGSKKPRLYIFDTENNKRLVAEIQQYHWDPLVGKGDRQHLGRDLPVKSNDDLLDALRYAVYSEETGGAEDGPVERLSPILQPWKRASAGFLGL
jgi:hypothetical protein